MVYEDDAMPGEEEIHIDGTYVSACDCQYLQLLVTSPVTTHSLGVRHRDMPLLNNGNQQFYVMKMMKWPERNKSTRMAHNMLLLETANTFGLKF